MTQTVVLLPGLVCDRDVWAAQQAALSPAFEAIAWPHFYDHDSLASMAEAVLAAAPPHFALAGHSMGARVALQIMATAPERVARLALLDTGVLAAAPDEAARRQPLLDVAANDGMRALARRWIPDIVHPDRLNDGALLTAMIDMICRATPNIYAAQIKALLARPDFRPLLPNIACPTLVLVGREDKWSPLSAHEDMACAIPGAKLVVVERCGHMATVEQPGAVTAALRDWLA